MVLPFRSIFTAHFSRIALYKDRGNNYGMWTIASQWFFTTPWEMVTATVSRRVSLTPTYVPAAPTDSLADTEQPVNRSGTTAPVICFTARVADRKDSILFLAWYTKNGPSVDLLEKSRSFYTDARHRTLYVNFLRISLLFLFEYRSCLLLFVRNLVC